MKTTLKISFLLTFSIISFVIFADSPGGGTDSQCLAGGPGATTCNYEYEFPNPIGGTTSCSVTCTPPAYACCYLELTHVKCVCKTTTGTGGGGTSR